MRLLNVTTLKLEEYLGADIPRYSILSHRWEDEELTFQGLVSGRYSELKGYQKVLSCCRLSRDEGYKYTWIDCCCIDKSSSAELTEAINSMFRWYKNAAVCYAYLSDVQGVSDLPASKWFERGWTLQELIGPDTVVFLNAQWREIGTRASLVTAISTITGIDESILGTTRPRRDITESLRQLSVAKKMSWAAMRVTTKVEDMAYCLMGLFDVNMPLIYGEGDKAFRRLQKEIIDSSDDDSIFAWSYSGEECTGSFSGILADSPSCFRNMNDVDAFPHGFEISRNDAKLRINVVGTVRGLFQDLMGSLSLICRVSDPSRSLISTIHDEYPADDAILDAMVGVLQCRTGIGRIVLLLCNYGAHHNIRYHFDGHLYFLKYGTMLQPPRALTVPLHFVQSHSHSNPRELMPAVHLYSRVVKLGYRLWATSTAPTPDAGQKSAHWFRAREGRGYLLFENQRSPKWPPFMLAYRYQPEHHHFGLYCGLVAEDFMPDNAIMASEEVEFVSSQDLSELRVWLSSSSDLVIKVRIKPHCCDLILLVAQKTLGNMASG